ncbi:unnamed protein product [Paramecium sonneborni]|uniref:VHS domain-containing protein n=1 Tax=Paramecium sonneborni TaxID=65129 RepID=A0A8S1PJ60_9CILI|nr:unnamed protein product [Paramecium sonneborni]
MEQFISQLGDKKFGKELEQLVEMDDEQTMNQFVQAMKKIMNEKYPPKECLYGLKIVKDCIEKFNDSFKLKVKQELMDIIYQIATYRIKDQDDTRGATYFKNPEHDKTIEQYGASYHRLALDCIRVWAKWFPDFMIYQKKLEQENGYLPQINYFKQDQIEKYIPKIQATPTPQDETQQIQIKAQELQQQLINLFIANNDENNVVINELATINAQVEDLLLLDIQNEFVDDFIMSYQDYQGGNLNYNQLRQQFLRSHQSQFKQQDPLIKNQSNIQASKIQKPPQQQYFTSENDDNYIQSQIQQQKNEDKVMIENLKQIINQKDGLISSMKLDLQKQISLNDKLSNENNQKQTENLKLQQEVNILQQKLNDENQYYQDHLLELQQQIQHYQQQLEQSKQQIAQSQIRLGQSQFEKPMESQIALQNLQEELENLRVERNLLLEQQRIFQQKSSQVCSQLDYMNLKKKYDDLDSKYFLLKQENQKLRQQTLEYNNYQSANQSRNIDSVNREIDYQDEIQNQKFVFYNFKDSDLQSQVLSVKSQQQTTKLCYSKEVQQLIYPHKTASEYYRINGKKQFRGIQISRNQFQLQLNSTNIINFKKASINQLAILFQSNKVEIKSRQQIIYGNNQQEYISTTLSIKNRELKPVQVQIINYNKNVWVNKDLKSILLQSQQQILYEFIREAQIQTHQQTQLSFSINFENFILYLPNFILTSLKFYQIEALSFKTIKQQFLGKVYKTQLLPIGCALELKQLSQKGVLLNNWELENEELITESKFGFKAVLLNQLEFYMELITTPCEEFLFRGFTSFDEELLQFILNGLSNLFS